MGNACCSDEKTKDENFNLVDKDVDKQKLKNANNAQKEGQPVNNLNNSDLKLGEQELENQNIDNNNQNIVDTFGDHTEHQNNEKDNLTLTWEEDQATLDSLENLQNQTIKSHFPSTEKGTPVLEMLKTVPKVKEILSSEGEFSPENFSTLKNNFSNIPTIGPIKLESGDTYIGQMKNGERHGYGKQIYSDGSIHEGFFENGKAHGIGRSIFDDGEFYVGNWANGQKNGMGKEVIPDEGIYEGNFVDNEKSGKGIFKYKNGDVYDGEWKDDERNGYG